MYQIIAKTDSKNFYSFRNNFKFEAYIGEKYEPKFFSKNRKKFKNIHLPTFFVKKNKKYHLNLISENSFIKKESFKILNRYFNLCKKTKINNLIIHAGFYDSTKSKKLDFYLIRLNNDLKKFFGNKINLYFENVPKWFNQYNKNSPLNSNLSELKLFKKFVPKSKILIDVDHLSINCAFEYFHNAYNFRNFTNDKLEKDYLKFAKRNSQKIKRLINKNIKNVVSYINPKLVHAVGSDFLNYSSYKKLPLIGEALPLNFSGKIQGKQVTDQINHKTWMRNKKSKLIIVEIINRPDYLYEEEIIKSFNFIRSNKNYVSNYTRKKKQ